MSNTATVERSTDDTVQCSAANLPTASWAGECVFLTTVRVSEEQRKHENLSEIRHGAGVFPFQTRPHCSAGQS